METVLQKVLKCLFLNWFTALVSLARSDRTRNEHENEKVVRERRRQQGEKFM